MTKKTHYSSNNSGGNWWLTDKNWKDLEDAGWEVDWEKYRFLDALATSASRNLPIDQAIREFEEITGENANAEGCSCCGQPHYFSED